MAKRRYNTIAFFYDRPPCKHRGVSNLFSYSQFLNKLGQWRYINVYDQQTKNYIRRIYNNGGYIPPQV